MLNQQKDQRLISQNAMYDELFLSLNQMANSDQQNLQIPQNNIQMFQCPHCQSWHLSKHALQTHISNNPEHRQLQKDVKKLQKQEKRKCPWCPKITTRKYKMDLHKLKCGERPNFIDQVIEEEKKQGFEPHAQYQLFISKDGKKQSLYATGDGYEDLARWASIPPQMQKFRDPVIIECDITKLDFDYFIHIQKNKYNKLFSVILSDLPWQLDIGLAYPTMKSFKELPLHKLQTDGYWINWIVDEYEDYAYELMNHFKYKVKGKFYWYKKTKNNNPINGSGVTLRKSTEVAIVGGKGNVKDLTIFHTVSGTIESKVRGESIKPKEIYERIEKLVPNAYYLELFARGHNVRVNWVSIGNQIRKGKI